MPIRFGASVYPVGSDLILALAGDFWTVGGGAAACCDLKSRLPGS